MAHGCNKLSLSCFFTFLFIGTLGGCSGCGKDGDEDADADADADDGVEDPGLDPAGDDAAEVPDSVEEDAADEDVPLPPPLDRALLIDLDLMHHSAWLDLEAACDSAGIELEYRRFFPHVSDADTAGESAYPFIMVAAGAAPGMAASRLSTDEIERMAAFVREGGILLLMPYPTRLDSYSGENDWYVLNRVLEVLESQMRVERGSLLGPLFLGSPDPPHLDSEIGYATLLEFDIGYGWALANAETGLADVLDGPLPAGRATVLRTQGSGVAVLLHAQRGGNLWIRTEGTTIDEQIRSITDSRPVAAVEGIGSGILALVPRFLVTLGGAGGQVSEHPANSTASIQRNAVFLRWLMAYLARLHSGEEELVPTDPSGGDDELFWVSSPSRPPAGEGEVISVAYEPSARPVAPLPPDGTLFEDFLDAPADTPPPAVAIFEGMKGKIGYGGMPWDDAAAGTVLSEAAAMGIDALVGGFTPERLVTGELSDAEAAAMREALARLADLAASAGVYWLVGSYYTGHVYNTNPSIFPRSVGAQRQTYNAPPLLYAPLWDDYLIPAAEEVAAAAAGHDGIGGILIDMEMYGTVLTYTDAQAFDDTTYDVYLETVTDSELRSLLEAQITETRLDVLIEQGLLADYLDVLTQAAAAIGARYREAVSALASNFTVALYFPNIPTCWQYRGLIQGLGTEDNPAVILTYDPFSLPYRANMAAGGAYAVHLGGPIVSHFPPEALTAVLGNCGAFTDGFWYFSHDEISQNASQELVFGTRAEYRDAVTQAGEDL